MKGTEPLQISDSELPEKANLGEDTAAAGSTSAAGDAVQQRQLECQDSEEKPMPMGGVTPMLFPLVSVVSIEMEAANELLVSWGHRIGPCLRPDFGSWAHALLIEQQPVAVATTHTLVRERVGGGLSQLTRENAVELSRLCATPGSSYCRPLLRLWREAIFPRIPLASGALRWAISYQDAALHSGNLYRFDGWQRAGFGSSGRDQRSGRRGRARWIWVWPRLNELPEAKMTNDPAAAPKERGGCHAR